MVSDFRDVGAGAWCSKEWVLKDFSRVLGTIEPLNPKP